MRREKKLEDREKKCKKKNERKIRNSRMVQETTKQKIN